jgi:hypothetical protein
VIGGNLELPSRYGAYGDVQSPLDLIREEGTVGSGFHRRLNARAGVARPHDDDACLRKCAVQVLQQRPPLGDAAINAQHDQVVMLPGPEWPSRCL